jgi:4,4'-diaponeurosporenoate glycosyltransferase
MDITDLIIQTVFWSLGFFFLFRIPRCRKSSGKIESYPSVSIIIPARNEEKSLPVLLESLKDQYFIPDEIIVVIDRSEDRTEEIAESAGVITIQSEPLPKGWIGKTWACHQGSQAAKGNILVFLDADTCIEKDGLNKIVGTCLRRDGVVSIQPYHRTERLYEQLSAFFNIIVMGAMGTFTIVGNLLKPIGLFGPCVVMRKKYYLEIGGHIAVKGEVVEDLALGNKLKKRQIPIYCYGGKGTISFRMYPNGIRELVDGWSKGFATGAIKTYIPILLAIIAWVGGGISATMYVIEAISNVNSISILVWTLTYLGYTMQIYWMLFRLGTFRFYTALFYPVSLIFFLVIFLRSFFIIFIRRRVRWKGITIPLKDEARKK